MVVAIILSNVRSRVSVVLARCQWTRYSMHYGSWSTCPAIIRRKCIPLWDVIIYNYIGGSHITLVIYRDSEVMRLTIAVWCGCVSILWSTPNQTLHQCRVMVIPICGCYSIIWCACTISTQIIICWTFY